MAEIVFSAFLLWKNANNTWGILNFTDTQPYFNMTLNPKIIRSYNSNMSGNISNSLITYDKPAAIPQYALMVADMNVCSDNKAGCFSTNIRIANDTIKVDGRLRNLQDLWDIYALTKWDSNQKELMICKISASGSTLTLIDRKEFAVQINDLNWNFRGGFGEEIDYTLQLKVVDQKSNNPLS